MHMHDDSEGEINRDQEMVAEAKLLRQHKGRLEARMQILEDHNRQLEAQLMRLRQLLEQVKFIYLLVVVKFNNSSKCVLNNWHLLQKIVESLELSYPKYDS